MSRRAGRGKGESRGAGRPWVYNRTSVCMCDVLYVFGSFWATADSRQTATYSRDPLHEILSRIQTPVPCSRGVIIFVSPRFLGRGSSGAKRGQYVSICGVAVDTAQVNMRHHNSSSGPSKRHLPPPITLTPSRASTEVPPVVSTLEKHPSHDMLNTKLGPDGKGDAGDVALPPISSMLC